MDLTVTSKKCVFGASCGFADIIIYFCRYLDISPDAGLKIKLTRKETKDLTKFLKKNSTEAGCSSWIIDELSEMVMFMSEKEKVEFYFW